MSETFELENEDCALVIKKDMTTELVIPKFGDNADITWQENQNMFVAIAIAASMDNPEFMAIVSKRLDEIMAQAGNDKSESCGTEAAPGCGSCCGCGTKEEPTDED